MMKKLTPAQVRHLMATLKAASLSTVELLGTQLREAIVPPKFNKQAIKKQLTKLAYDKPMSLVNMCLKWAQGQTPRLLTTQVEARDAAFTQYNNLMRVLREHAETLRNSVHTQLLWEEFPVGKFPEYLIQEHVDSLVSFVTKEDS